MASRRLALAGMGVCVWSLAAGLVPATGQQPAKENRSLSAAGGSPRSSLYVPPVVPLDSLPEKLRDKARLVVERPTLSVQGPVEVFACDPETYAWLLDRPDQAVKLWRALGAKCTDIQDRGHGRFGYRDELGSDIHWETVLADARRRVWYAEGQVKPAILLPAAQVQAVLALDFVDGFDSHGRPAVKHQMHLVLHTDSHAVALATRFLGSSAPRVAEQYVAQIEMFFGALAWYLDQNPAHARELLAAIEKPGKTPAPPRR
jgi:hypothetical protein